MTASELYDILVNCDDMEAEEFEDLDFIVERAYVHLEMHEIEMQELEVLALAEQVQAKALQG